MLLFVHNQDADHTAKEEDPKTNIEITGLILLFAILDKWGRAAQGRRHNVA
jgi:hypothetical protein